VRFDRKDSEQCECQQWQDLKKRGDNLNHAGFGDTAHIDQRDQPERTERHGQSWQPARHLGQEMADIAGEGDRDAGIAGPQ
jgi:hypothetical protein